MRQLILSFVLVLMLASCEKHLDPIGPDDGSGFSIYLLEDSTITIADAIGKNLNDLKLCSTPWLSAQDIDFYDFSSHCIYLKADKGMFFPALNRGLFPHGWWARPFVAVANGQRRYLGVFHGGFSNWNWPVPYIEDFENTQMYPEDVLHVSWIWLLRDNGDSRNDQTVRRSLEQGALYHGGVAVTLKAIQLLQNSDSATIAYTFSVTNTDIDALYVLDPDLMGASLFNYFNLGPQIANSTTATVYITNHSSVIQPVPFDSWSQAWFKRLASGTSIERTVIVPGYPHFPSGSYLGEFQFIGPRNIDKIRRVLADGRYWIGPTTSSVYSWTVQ